MNRINVERPFILYCNATIEYNGRAKSTCNHGNYIIFRKGDGTLQIHGNTLSKPLNYQPPGAVMHKDGCKLISVRKNETIVIIISSIIDYIELPDWSTNKIELVGNEFDYRTEYIKNIPKTFIKEIYTEFKTPNGAIDLLILDNNDVYHIYEFKRRKAGLNGCSQLLRYLEYFKSVSGKKCIGYLVAPSISKNALKFLIDNDVDFIEFEM